MIDKIYFYFFVLYIVKLKIIVKMYVRIKVEVNIRWPGPRKSYKQLDSQ